MVQESRQHRTGTNCPVGRCPGWSKITTTGHRGVAASDQYQQSLESKQFVKPNDPENVRPHTIQPPATHTAPEHSKNGLHAPTCTGTTSGRVLRALSADR